MLMLLPLFDAYYAASFAAAAAFSFAATPCLRFACRCCRIFAAAAATLLMLPLRLTLYTFSFVPSFSTHRLHSPFDFHCRWH